MGAIEYRRVSLLAAGLLVAACMWVIANPSRANAGNWRSHEQSWDRHSSVDGDEYEYHYSYSYSHGDKYDESDCECRDDHEYEYEYDEETTGSDCEGPVTPDDDGAQGGDDSSADDPADPIDPADPAEPVLELNIDQQVQVGGGAFVDAEDDATAPEGQVGDPVVWQVVVGADEAADDEDRTVKITWDEPENVDVTGSEVTSGSFDGTTWTVGIGNMPATLTVRSTLNGEGLGASTARIAEISCDDSGSVDADGFCDFEDNVLANNTNPAGVMAMPKTAAAVPITPGVLGSSTTRPPRSSGAVLASENHGPGRVLASSSDRALAATGINYVLVFFVGGLLSLAPLAVVRVRK